MYLYHFQEYLSENMWDEPAWNLDYNLDGNRTLLYNNRTERHLTNSI